MFDGIEMPYEVYNSTTNKYNFNLKSESDEIEDDSCPGFEFKLHINKDSSPYIYYVLKLESLKESIESLDISPKKLGLAESFNSVVYDSAFVSEIIEQFTYGLFHMVYVNGNPTYNIDVDVLTEFDCIELPKVDEVVKDPRQDVRTKAWNGAVKLKDGFKCRRCGSDSRLNAHHIIPICAEPQLAFDINNGISLCERCHVDFHSKYGNLNIGHFECYEFIRNFEHIESQTD